MPLRVKCRCGQELVLRFNEWVHALFGLLVVSLIINGTALAYIAFKLDTLKGPVPAEEIRPAAPSAKDADAGPPPPAPPPSPAPATPPPAAAPGEAGDPRKPPRPSPGGEEPPGPVPPPLSPQGSKGSPAGPREPPVQGPVEKPVPGDGGKEGAGSTPAAVPRAEAVRRPGQDLLPPGTGPLETLLVLEKCGDLRLLFAFLSDGDECVRRAALKKCLSAPAPSGPLPERNLLLIALPAAPWLLDHGGGDLLPRLAGGDHGPDARAWWEWARGAIGFDEAKGTPGEIWLPLATRAQVLKESSAAAQAIEKASRPVDGKEPRGADVLLAIDVTESMEEPLAALSRSGWVFLALSWAIPDLRLGFLWYDDEVKGSLPLGTEPREIARFIPSLKAEGGGDVPEGVHEALKAALQLGRFDWRPEAAKHIFFIGDGPPRRAEVPALLSLAKECHEEGGFKVHAISVNAAEGRTATLHFPELASAGGGRAVTAQGDRIAAEVFLTLFPPEARDELGRLLPIDIPSAGGEASAPPAPTSPPPWK